MRLSSSEEEAPIVNQPEMAHSEQSNSNHDGADDRSRGSGQESQKLTPVPGAASSHLEVAKETEAIILLADDAKQRSQRIDQWLESEAASEKRQLRVLLLGDFDQTDIFWKQTRLLSTPFSEEERVDVRHQVRSTMLRCMKDILRGFLEILQQKATETEPSQRATRLLEKLNAALEESTPDASDIDRAQRLMSIYRDPTFCTDMLEEGLVSKDQDRRALGLAHCLPVSCTCAADTATVGQLERVFDLAYEPTDHDWFHFDRRNVPMMIRQTDFNRTNYTLSIIDLPTKAGERRKWIHMLDHCACIVVVVDVAHYPESYPEYEGLYPMRDSLSTFESIASSDVFQDTPILLILSNEKALRANLDVWPLSKAFSEYTGLDADQAVDFLVNHYLQRAKGRENVFVSVCDIDDAAGINGVFESMEGSVLKGSLKGLVEQDVS
ncbi:hypothetical protein FZEAL_9057 [Fusarium zealandicum]|uniref:Uncharacterized protein n=1 Tax=Fusarium zealandicum TaxID=1053134 RepID=A0A8H4XGW3_9HYPO|nr:hypothetical protein FZEAL_9057 [Fusarium zealandicum]